MTTISATPSLDTPPTVTELGVDAVARLQGGWNPNLGDGSSCVVVEALEQHVGSVQRRGGEDCRTFLVEWTGSNIPRGAMILGKEVGWVQNGFISSTRFEQIGTYERLQINGGDSKREQKMIVRVRSKPGAL